MLFNSFEFILFFILVIMVYFVLPRKLRWILLLGASYYFYMAWKPEYVLLIIMSTVVDYYAGILMEKQSSKQKRKKFLYLSLVINLGILFVFKYFNFFNHELSLIFESISSRTYPIRSMRILLPMGISFYTFQTLSYTIDVYRGKRKAERHFGYFALYVTYFPQLVAGPIERSDRLIPQLKKDKKFNAEELADGLVRVCWGLFKKMVIADRAAVIVNHIYGSLHSYDGVYLILATILFAVQIYCDFSGYSDIAIGTARIMGVNLMENFQMPYFAESISGFWKRWHISLSTWFKDYLYIPIGGNRSDNVWKRYRNILIVFLVSGLWHGANWTFIVWGLLHGLYQLGERIISSKTHVYKYIPLGIRRLSTLILVLLAWVFFRSESLSDSMYIIESSSIYNIHELFNGGLVQLGLDLKDVLVLFHSSLILFISEAVHIKYGALYETSQTYYEKITVSTILALVVLLFGYYGNYSTADFIYFQF